MMKTYEVFNQLSGHSFGFYAGTSADDAIESCVRDAGYSSVATMCSELDQPCELRASRVVPVPADSDEDDCLQAAADRYAAAHGLEGWDLSPRWEHGSNDSVRDTVILTVPDHAE